MNLMSYLEIMTAAERAQAFDAGQTNLDPAGVQLKQDMTVKKKKMIPKEILGVLMYDNFFKDIDKKNNDYNYRNSHRFFLIKTGPDYVWINKPKTQNDRLVMAWDGTTYFADPDDMVHNRIIGRMMYDGVLEMNKKDLTDWWFEPYKSTKKFMTFQRRGKNVYFGESNELYGDEDGMGGIDDFVRTPMYKHYKDMLKTKFGFTLIPEIYDQYAD